MIGFDVEGEKRMQSLLDELGANADKAVSVALLRCAQHAEGEIKRTAQKTFNPGTGNLMRSFTAQMLAKKGDTLSAGAVSNLVYAEIQNDGGTIRSSRGPGKNLAVPAKGRFKPPAPWPSDFNDDAFSFIPSKKPGITGILVEKLAKGQTGKFGKGLGRWMYTLMPEVTIKSTRYIERAKEKSSKEWPRVFNERLAELVDGAAKKAGG